MKDSRVELRLKYPRLGLKADYGNSPIAAIKLKCLDCACLDRKAISSCQIYICSLWRYRPSADSRIIPEGYIPTEQEYQALIEAGITEGQKKSWQLGKERLSVTDNNSDRIAEDSSDIP